MKCNSAYSYLEKGRALLEEGRPEQAVTALERARSCEPHKGSVLELLGRAYFSCGRYAEAAARFEEALDVDPTNDYAHYCLGLCCLKLDRKDEAGGHFRVAWSLRPREIYREKAARFKADGASGGHGAPGFS